MTRRYWGSLNFLKPEWREDKENAAEFVVDSYRDGPSDLRVAYELLALAGCLDVARRLNELLERAYARDKAILDDNETNEVIDILGNIEEPVRKSLLDENDRVPLATIGDLRTRSTIIDFGDAVGHHPEDGVAEGLSRVFGVRDAIVNARDRGLNVSLN